MKAALVIAMVATSGSAPLAESGVQTLQGQLDQVVQAWQTGWVADTPYSGGVPARQLFRWHRGDAVLTIGLRTLADAPSALADVDATPGLLSTGAAAASGIGDRAYVASLPGGFSTVYVAVGPRVFTVDVQDVPDAAKALAVQVVPVIQNYSGL
jgi:hypothetical protein